jgi:hypothetical protein
MSAQQKIPPKAGGIFYCKRIAELGYEPEKIFMKRCSV